MTEPLQYRLPWQSTAVYPGAHPGRMVGAGQLFNRHEPLISSPDPRRIDLRASVLDPFGGYRVRVFLQQSTVNVYLIADLSASMGLGNKSGILQQLLLDLADAVAGYGDKLGFIGCSQNIEPRWRLNAGRQHQAAIQLVQQLQKHHFKGLANALSEAAAYLPARRSLVFLFTDCHFPMPQLETLLRTLQTHDVVPLVPSDLQHYLRLPDWGMVTFKDMENRGTRTLLMRPALKQKIIAAHQQRQRELTHCFRAFGMEPMFIEDAYSSRQINQYFRQRAA